MIEKELFEKTRAIETECDCESEIESELKRKKRYKESGIKSDKEKNKKMETVLWKDFAWSIILFVVKQIEHVWISCRKVPL